MPTYRSTFAIRSAMACMSLVRTRAARRYSTAGTNWPWRNVAGHELSPSVICLRVISSKTAAASVPSIMRDGAHREVVGEGHRHQVESQLAEDHEFLALVGRAVVLLDVADLQRGRGRPSDGHAKG